MKNYIYILSSISLMLSSCSNLEEDVVGVLEAETLSNQEKVIGQINGAQNQLQAFQNTDFMFVLQEHPSDEMAGPTRGADWDDGGAWRDLHLHTWNSSHPRVQGAWDQILGGLFFATDALSYEPTTEQFAQATFFRSFYIFMATDLFGQVPVRQPGASFSENPEVLKRNEAIALAISELEAVINDLPLVNTPGKPNRYSAAALLAKMYLNKAVYLATDEDGTPQAGPFTFENADMQKVVQYCDIVLGGPFTLQANYFDNFNPSNTSASTEAILSSVNTNDNGGELRRMYFMTLHYNQKPSGWNGFVALTDLYNKFEATDSRLKSSLPYLNTNSGLTAGILQGPQVNEFGAPVLNRAGSQLTFSQDFSLTNSDDQKGMRVIKYLPDYSNIDRPNNDFVIFRLADVLLMKAEAMARMNQDPSALLSQLRTVRGVAYTGAGLSDILDERARELYWEGWRRQDQIRYSTFLGTWQEKLTNSDRAKIIFPIPASAVSTNPNLVQNPSY